MKELSLLNEEDNELIKYFPADLRTENYMILRVCLRKSVVNNA